MPKQLSIEGTPHIICRHEYICIVTQRGVVFQHLFALGIRGFGCYPTSNHIDTREHSNMLYWKDAFYTAWGKANEKAYLAPDYFGIDNYMDDPNYRARMDAAWNDYLDDAVSEAAAIPTPVTPKPVADYHDKTIMPFGKHRGKALEQIPDDYFFWLYGQPNLDPKMKKYIETYLPGAKVRHTYLEQKQNINNTNE